MNNSIVILESISGSKPSEQFDFLNIQVGHRATVLVAHLRGNGYVKLFILQSYYEYFVLNQEDAVCQHIDQATYDSNLLLERFIKHHYFGMPLFQEELMFGFMGNGVSVCDKLRTQNHDYMQVAHIVPNRQVTYYNPVSDEGRARIEKFAESENITIGSQGISALSPVDKVTMKNEENRKLLEHISSRFKRKRSYLDLHNDICVAFNGLSKDCKFDVNNLISAWYRNECDFIRWFNSMLPDEQEQLLKYYRKHSPVGS